ncbi:hypothetical protein [Vulcanisaeta souniana]|nr:hypothetical protein [Vulcanisaeta souniana]
MASVIISYGTWLLYKGVGTEKDYFYLQSRIAGTQPLADRMKTLVNGTHT